MWTKTFNETGGYDAQYGAWEIRDPDGDIRIVVDQQYYGQQPCDYSYRSPQAKDDAACICVALSVRDQ